MATAFQSNAFQNNAFQISGGAIFVDTHDGSPDEWKRHRERLLRQARAAQKAIYRNVPQAINARKIATDMREHLLPSKHVETPEIVYPPVIHTIDRMPLANPLQWLLDDDEEAIGWLM